MRGSKFLEQVAMPPEDRARAIELCDEVDLLLEDQNIALALAILTTSLAGKVVRHAKNKEHAEAYADFVRRAIRRLWDYRTDA